MINRDPQTIKVVYMHVTERRWVYTTTDPVPEPEPIINTAPVITILGDNPAVVEFGVPYTDQGVTVADAEDGDLTAEVTVISTVDVNTAGDYTVTYTVTDSGGLSAEVTRSVIVGAAANTIPSLTLNGPLSVVLPFGGPYTEFGATATDAEDGDLTSSIVTVSTVDVGTAGDYTVTYTVTDSGGLSASVVRNVSVAAEVVTAPTIELIGDSNITLPFGGPYTEFGAIATDTEDGDLTSSIVTVSTVDVGAAGDYTVTYTVTDSGGLSASVVRNVSVAAEVNNAPTIDLVGASSIELPFGGPYTEFGATATDTEDGDLTSSIVTVSTVDVGTAGDYTVTYTVTDSGGLSASVVRNVSVAAEVIDGYFFSPAGSAANDGSYDSPWSIGYAFDGATVPSGETLYALPGVYLPRPATGDDSLDSVVFPGQKANLYIFNHSNITLKAYGATASNPYPAVFNCGISIAVGSDNNTIEGLFLESTTPFPLEEPTIAGSPYPGYETPSPPPAPDGWAYWWYSGIITEEGAHHGNTIRCCVANGGSTGITMFQATDLTVDGCIFRGRGWVAVDRKHGHPAYLQNPSNDAGDRNTYVRCINSTSEERTASPGERTAMHFFATSPYMQNWDVLKCYLKGSGKTQSASQAVRNMVFEDIVGEAARIGTSAGEDGGDNISWGRPASSDTDITLTNISYVNGRKVANNNIQPTGGTLTQSNIRQIKTRSDWYVTQMDQPLEFSYTEVGTHVNAPVADEYYLWPITAASVNTAHVHILDLDDDGEVDVDLTGFATAGNNYMAFHYLNPGIIVQSGTLSASLMVTLPIVETNSETGLLDSTDAYVIRLIPN